MNKIFFSFALISSLFLASCTNSNTTEEVQSEPVCAYSYDSETIALVKWTAFKTTEKLPVGGQFTEVNVKSTNSGEVDDVLKSLSFSIPTISTNTTNPERDQKIIKSFFGAMDETNFIIGKTKSVAGNNESGKCTFLLTLNNVEKEVDLEYTVEEDKVILNGEIDLVNFGAEKAVNSLNEVCKLLHTGADGVSKTWSTVEVQVELFLKKECK